MRTDFPVKHGNKSTYASIVAANSSWASMWGTGLETGRFLSQEDNVHLARVAVIGKTIHRDLFEYEDPVGKRILINNNPFEIIGVLEPRGTSPRGDDMDNQIIIPVSTGQKRVFHQDYLFAIKVELKDSSNMSRTVNDIRDLLRERHNLREGVEDDFTIVTPTLIMNMMSSLSATFSLFLMLVSGISLVVGAIVIANIMFMAVNERRAEIGLRRAVGARKRDILVQFLLEAVCVATTGGVLGVVPGTSWTQALVRLHEIACCHHVAAHRGRARKCNRGRTHSRHSAGKESGQLTSYRSVEVSPRANQSVTWLPNCHKVPHRPTP